MPAELAPELRSLFIIVVVAALAPLVAELGHRFLPVVVAEILATIGLETDRMTSETAAALVGAAMVSVLVYPLVALGFRRRVRGVLTPETA